MSRILRASCLAVLLASLCVVGPVSADDGDSDILDPPGVTEPTPVVVELLVTVITHTGSVLWSLML